jgi:hypothetical protein
MEPAVSRPSVVAWAYPVFLVVAIGTLVVSTIVFLREDSDAALTITQLTLAVILLVTGVHDWKWPTNRVSRPSSILRVLAGSAFLVVWAGSLVM